MSMMMLWMIMILLKEYDKAIGSSNSTTHALVVADLLDEVLRNYADAIVTDIDLTNMSNLVLLDNKESRTTSYVISEDDSSNVNYTNSSQEIIQFLILLIMKQQRH